MAVIRRTIINYQYFNVWICLIDKTSKALQQVIAIVVVKYIDGNQWVKK